MAVWLTQFARTGNISTQLASIGGGTPVPHYDATVTSKTAAIGAAIELDASTTGIAFADDVPTSFRWGIVATEGASLPANSPVWLSSVGSDQPWSVGKAQAGGARWFKTAAL